MARPEKPLDPDAGPVAQFADALRRLRRQARLSYRALAQRTGYSPSSSLSQAQPDRSFPPSPLPSPTSRPATRKPTARCGKLAGAGLRPPAPSRRRTVMFRTGGWLAYEPADSNLLAAAH
ncbi:helix-turn-helix domain-containing protein [Streptomyces melanogenes]|uniref:helix-turn-helix domain-containing protein n=1 Tax=Streptomyces melanogenes TaxID=67326 RepID=UPI00379BEA07